jgi:hypothetical protein
MSCSYAKRSHSILCRTLQFFMCVVRVQTSINSLISLEVVLVKLNMMLFLEANNII